MAYVLVADRLKKMWGEPKFGWAPRHPKDIKDGVVTSYVSGKIPEGMSFDWNGDPESPPAWASPTCEEGRAAYRRACSRVLSKEKLPRMTRDLYEGLQKHVKELEDSAGPVASEGGGVTSDVAGSVPHLEDPAPVKRKRGRPKKTESTV